MQARANLRSMPAQLAASRKSRGAIPNQLSNPAKLEKNRSRLTVHGGLTRRTLRVDLDEDAFERISAQDSTVEIQSQK